MKILDKRSLTETKTYTDIDYVSVTDELLVYRTTMVNQTTAGKSKPKESEESYQGFALKTVFKRWVVGDHSTHKVGKKAEGLCFFKDGFQEMCRKYGHPGHFKKWTYDMWEDYEVDDPFDAFVRGDVFAKNIMRSTFSIDGMLWNADGNPLPVGIYSDYLSGIHISNSCYDLEKALGILKNNKDVWFPNSSSIVSIPHYNHGTYSNTTIEFMWTPSQEEYVNLWEKQKSYKGSYPSTEDGRAMFDLDVLGLRAGGAAMYDNYFTSKDYE